MSERREAIAELYYRSGSVRFGSFPLSVHRDQPDLPPSPIYMHYPPVGQGGSHYLPRLFELIADEFYDIAEERKLDLHSKKITGLPQGALLIADELANKYPGRPDNLLVFSKIEHKDGRLEFGAPEGLHVVGEPLQPVEDHISGGRNNLKFAAHVRKFGFVVTELLVVVDRQQGATKNLAAQGIEVIPIFTVTELLLLGQAAGHVKQTTINQVQDYLAENQIDLTQPLNQ